MKRSKNLAKTIKALPSAAPSLIISIASTNKLLPTENNAQFTMNLAENFSADITHIALKNFNLTLPLDTQYSAFIRDKVFLPVFKKSTVNQYDQEYISWVPLCSFFFEGLSNSNNYGYCSCTLYSVYGSLQNFGDDISILAVSSYGQAPNFVPISYSVGNVRTEWLSCTSQSDLVQFMINSTYNMALMATGDPNYVTLNDLFSRINAIVVFNGQTLVQTEDTQRYFSISTGCWGFWTSPEQARVIYVNDFENSLYIPNNAENLSWSLNCFTMPNIALPIVTPSGGFRNYKTSTMWNNWNAQFLQNTTMSSQMVKLIASILGLPVDNVVPPGNTQPLIRSGTLVCFNNNYIQTTSFNQFLSIRLNLPDQYADFRLLKIVMANQVIGVIGDKLKVLSPIVTLPLEGSSYFTATDIDGTLNGPAPIVPLVADLHYLDPSEMIPVSPIRNSNSIAISLQTFTDDIPVYIKHSNNMLIYFSVFTF